MKWYMLGKMSFLSEWIGGELTTGHKWNPGDEKPVKLFTKGCFTKGCYYSAKSSAWVQRDQLGKELEEKPVGRDCLD